jgi:hypothetical protein
MKSESPPGTCGFAPAQLRRRDDGWTPARQRVFIERFAVSGSVKSACRFADMSPATAYKLRQPPAAVAFADAWDAARSTGFAALTDIAVERAMYGQKQEVFYKGEMVGFRTVYDNRMLMGMLLNRGPLADNRFHQPLYRDDTSDDLESVDEAYGAALVDLDAALAPEEAEEAAAEADSNPASCVSSQLPAGEEAGEKAATGPVHGPRGPSGRVQPDQGNDARHDPVPREGREAVAADHRYERADDDHGDHERDDEADRDVVDLARVQQGAVLDQFEDGRAEHRRDCKEKAELGGSAPLDPHRQRAHDRRARPADPGDHREALSEADADRDPHRNIGDAVDGDALRHAFDEQDGDTADDQRDRNDLGMTEQRLDLLVQREADDRGGDKGEQDVADETQRHRIA